MSLSTITCLNLSPSQMLHTSHILKYTLCTLQKTKNNLTSLINDDFECHLKNTKLHVQKESMSLSVGGAQPEIGGKV